MQYGAKPSVRVIGGMQMSVVEDRPAADIMRTRNQRTKAKPLSAKAQRMPDDLDAVLSRPDPIGPEGWEAVRQHAREYGLRIGSSE